MNKRVLETEVDRQARAWRKSGHEITWLFAQRQRDDLDEALFKVIDPLQKDEPIDADDVRQARAELDQTRQLLEEYLVPMVDDVDPWGEGAGSTIPYNVFADHLEAAGYTVARPEESVVVVESDD